MGKLPLFGFQAHRWPYYYGAPREIADSVAAIYTAISNTEDPIVLERDLKLAHVEWVVVESGTRATNLPVFETLNDYFTPSFADSFLSIYDFRSQRIPSEEDWDHHNNLKNDPVK